MHEETSFNWKKRHISIAQLHQNALTPLFFLGGGGVEQILPYFQNSSSPRKTKCLVMLTRMQHNPWCSGTDTGVYKQMFQSGEIFGQTTISAHPLLQEKASLVYVKILWYHHIQLTVTITV
jgi:hypothetical protein